MARFDRRPKARFRVAAFHATLVFASTNPAESMPTKSLRSAAVLLAALALLGACGRHHEAQAASMATCSDIAGDAPIRIAGCSAVIQSPTAPADTRAKAFNNRGVLFAGQDDDRAIADYGAAIGLDAHYAVPFYNRAQVWRRRGDTAKADADAAEAVRLDPSLAGR
jgi:tetratricopeptide (TPR) repeat protein